MASPYMSQRIKGISTVFAQYVVQGNAVAWCIDLSVDVKQFASLAVALSAVVLRRAHACAA